MALIARAAETATARSNDFWGLIMVRTSSWFRENRLIAIAGGGHWAAMELAN